MTLKAIVKELDDVIEEKYNSRKKFCEKTGRNYFNLTNLFNRIRKKNQTAHFEPISQIAEDLGYEFVIVKKKE